MVKDGQCQAIDTDTDTACQESRCSSGGFEGRETGAKERSKLVEWREKCLTNVRVADAINSFRMKAYAREVGA